MAPPSAKRDTAPTPDDDPFESEGSATFDAYHLARACLAVIVAAHDELPTLQFELFDEDGAGGVLVVAHDGSNLLRAWVPAPDPEGWKVTAEVAGPAPKLDEKPTRTVSAQLGTIGLKVLAELGKAKRAKDNPAEQVTLKWGTRPEGRQATLGADLKGRAVQLVTDEGTYPAHDPEQPFAWRDAAKAIESPDAATLDWGLRISGDMAITFGRIAIALGDDRRMLISPAMVDGRVYTRVKVPGFPAVQGYGVEL